MLAYIIVISVVVIVLLRLFKRTGFRKNRHVRMQEIAIRQLDKINGLAEFRQKIAYLRKINPFVFEEMLLEAIERSGCNVVRNKRYTGDGGIDGRAFINGQTFLIQAKRYGGHISKADVIKFQTLVESMECKGLFCHTGKTRDSIKASIAHGNVEVVSGQKLLNLLAGESYPYVSMRKFANE